MTYLSTPFRQPPVGLFINLKTVWVMAGLMLTSLILLAGCDLTTEREAATMIICTMTMMTAMMMTTVTMMIRA